MSEDKIFEILKDGCFLDENCVGVDFVTEEQLQAIRGLADLYQKEKRRRFECETALIEERDFRIDNFISEDKIINKIKECENNIENLTHFNNNEVWGKDILENIYAKAVLEDLLKEN